MGFFPRLSYGKRGTVNEGAAVASMQEAGTDDLALFMSGLNRWCLDVSDWDDLLPAQWSFLLSLLPEAERARVKRFVRENDQRLALGSRLLQRAVISQVFGLEFSEVEIGRTRENKPYFAGMSRALQEATAPTALRNWNFNVSHHGKYVAIASEPTCLCGMDIVDTSGRRRNEGDTAEGYLRYFTDHFTDKEWAAIRRTEDDDGRLRRFFLNWGLKESYVKAIGQGLGYNLGRISFVEGDWLTCLDNGRQCLCCCGCQVDGEVDKHSTCERENRNNVTDMREPCCLCADEMAAERKTDGCGQKKPAKDSKGDVEEEVTMEEEKWWTAGQDVAQRHCRSSFCTCRVGVAKVEVDGLLRTDWSFRVLPLADGYVACVARGPPSECSAEGRASGVITDPSVGAGGSGSEMERGLELPQVGFTAVRLADILPTRARAEFVSLGRKGDGKKRLLEDEGIGVGCEG